MNDRKLHDPELSPSPFTPNDGPDPRCTGTPIEREERWDKMRGLVHGNGGRVKPRRRSDYGRW